MTSSGCSSHPSTSVPTAEAEPEHQTTSRRTRYSGRGEVRHPPLAPSLLLTRLTSRPGRILSRKQTDPKADITYGRRCNNLQRPWHGSLLISKRERTDPLGERRRLQLLHVLHGFLQRGLFWHGRNEHGVATPSSSKPF